MNYLTRNDCFNFAFRVFSKERFLCKNDPLSTKHLQPDSQFLLFEILEKRKNTKSTLSTFSKIKWLFGKQTSL